MEPVERRGPHLTRRDASHQTGWTEVIAKLIQTRRLLDAETLLKRGKVLPSDKTKSVMLTSSVVDARAPGACNSGKSFRKPALEALCCVPTIRASGLAVRAIR